jgi:sec-independent protein translocase protein TatB
MFEISWSELLILGIVTLIFVGPKELPIFLRTLGRYAGSIKRQATEFRSQFDAAMREAELDAIKKEFEGMQATVNSEIMSAKTALSEAAASPPDALPPQTTVTAPALAQPAAQPPALPMPPMPAPPRMGP